jgi:hypothetical protein
MKRSRFVACAAVAAVAATAIAVAAPAATQSASAVSTTRPKAGGYFKTHAVGKPLPTGKQCAAKLHYSTWEPRPQNKAANHKVVPKKAIHLPKNTGFDTKWNQKYKSRITGNFKGTTDEIIQWASCKWGLSDELTRARAVQESHWFQSQEGDFRSSGNEQCPAAERRRNPCPTSFGILQSKAYYRPGTYPATKVSTAFNLDASLAELRGCIDGLQWFGPQSKGDVWGCVGVWFSGSYNKGGQSSYVDNVKQIYNEKPWRKWRG